MATMAQVAGFAYDAGLRDPRKLILATAVAWAESGGNQNAIGDTSLQNATWGPSYGLWQIRSLKADKGKGTHRDADRLPDPAHNAKAMASISGNGSNWQPWTVTHFTNPTGRIRYQAALLLAPTAVTAALALKGAGAAGDAVGDAAGAVSEPVRELAATVSEAVQTPARIVKWLTEPGTWIRIAYFGLGGAMLLGGVLMFVRPAAGSVASSAIKVVPAGKAAKIIKRVV